MATSGVEELAEDYKSSLEDLTFNSRWEITNLTVIAKENIHAAQAISTVIESHIQQTAPARKLPALYLLDSVAKNVGTPYTLFFGRNLYRTFMDAYSLVDPQIRRKLEEMLQTWKQPVPGSPSSTPVFPSEITRRIDNALIKARTAAVQAQQKQMKEDQAKFGINRSLTPNSSAGAASSSYKSTPTPPNTNISPYPMMVQNQKNLTLEENFKAAGSSQSSISNSQAIQHLTPKLPLPSAVNYSSPSLDSLYNDIDMLVKSTQKRLSEAAYDQEAQRKLKALLDLQSLLLAQQLPPDQISIVREQVYKLANAQTPPQPPPAFPPQPIAVQTSPPPLAPFNSGNVPNLAALLNAMPLPANPQVQPLQSQQITGLLNLQPTPAPQPTRPLQHAPQKLAATGGDLFSSLLSAGLITSQGGNTSLPPPNPMSMFSSLLSSTASNMPNPSAEPDSQTLLALKLAELELTSGSLKSSRSHLLSVLNESLPSRCSSCPRRFEDTEIGRKGKAAHLDWHFRVHQRMTENAKRGQNRSWYVGEEDWIRSREDDNEGVSATTNTGPTEIEASTDASAEPSNQAYVPVPDDPTLANTVCPICKERFETSWHNDAEEWVWMDAVKMGGRIYHATCYVEVTRDGGTVTPGSRGSTPDVGGFSKEAGGKIKRKAEDSVTLLGKTKRERI